MKVYFSIIIFSCVILSCTTLAKLGHGSRKPKVESETSIVKWLKSKGFDKGRVVATSPEEFYFFAPQFVNSIFLLDNTGRFHAIGYNQGKFCVKDVDKIIKRLKPADQLTRMPDSFIVYQYYKPFKIDNIREKTKAELKKILKEYKETAKVLTDTLSLNYSFLNSKIRTLSGQKLEQPEISATNYTLFLPFAKYEGNWVQVSELRKYYNAAINAENATFNIVFLNLDKQQWWGEEWNEKIKINQ